MKKTISDRFMSVYSTLGYYEGIPAWALTPLRRAIRGLASNWLPYYLSRTSKVVIPQSDSEIIVSFTSFPARIDNVWQVVECMLRQTVCPHKILLWLSKEQFADDNSIPERLRKMQNDVFEIRMVEKDFRSHKKYLYVSQEYPNNPVVLIDDDLYYPSDFIERLFGAFKKTGSVVAYYGSLITYNEDGSLKKYREWDNSYDECFSSNFFFGSGGGVLFVPSKLYEDLTNIELALKLCPSADDIWLNAMVRLSEQPIQKLKYGLPLPVNEENNESLSVVNVGLDKNDEQIDKVNDYYKRKLNKTVF